MQLQRELGVTYKCAWLILHKIRKMMASEETLEGEVEIDETFVHANVYKRSSAMKRYGLTGNRSGQVLVGITERGGKARIWHVPSAGARIVQPLIRKYVKPGTLIHSDGYMAYRKLPTMGYEHRWTDHSKKEFYTEYSSTQNIENLWSHIKRGIKGVYRNVSVQYLQLYANEFAWRYSHRKERAPFMRLLTTVS